nr:unnamed protein product [Digitaria exilis]
MRPSTLLAVPLLLVATFVVLTFADDANGDAAATSTGLHPYSATAAAGRRRAGCRTIRQVGKFAVSAYCLNTGARLAFVNVVGGQSQPYGGGARYRLVITVAVDDAGPSAAETTTTMAQYGVLVWGILGTTTWQLWYFAPNN